MPNDRTPWEAVYQQAQRWLAAGCFEQLADDLRALLRLASGRNPEPGAASLDSRPARHPSLASGPATMAPSARRARRSTWPSIRWANSWPYASPPPIRTTMPRSGVGPRLYRPPQTAPSIWPTSTKATPARSWPRPSNARHRTGGRQTARGQARLRQLAEALGGEALLRLGDALSSPRQGLRALSQYLHRSPHRRLRLSHA